MASLLLFLLLGFGVLFSFCFGLGASPRPRAKGLRRRFGRSVFCAPAPLTVSQSPRFISTAIRSGRYQDLCGAAEGLVQGAPVPNVGLRGTFAFLHCVLIHPLNPPIHTEAEMKQFKHTPLECIRLDLALAGAGASADVTAWHRVGAAMLQALVRSGYDGEATEIVGNWIGEGLAAYQGAKGNAGDGWKAKGSLVYLMTAVATRGKTASLSSLALCCSTWTGRRGWGGGWVWSAQRRIR
ncbi:hypothetical protein FIBSPDRAFT_940690 [Athelia psychrophila]|uniref:Uncharacterized protein n=1 Tax=Athelia psychrophila TaxID=1759441 RepID=A0A167VHA2_9AGAM|nr:hypothetical protein FIBSPDRAFT_940690 [Fibularhizoctonia sp. CBS 109695]